MINIMRAMLAGIALLPPAGHSDDASSSGPTLVPVARDRLCVTEGTIDDASDGLLAVNSDKMRAYADQVYADTAELSFVYRGATSTTSALASGQVRRQIGLKLRAADACNLVYAMWRIDPQSKLVVSVKTNRGQRTSAECGNRGYRNITPQLERAIPRVLNGDRHHLRAALNGQTLQVWADGQTVWQGNLGADADGLRGPVGVRSDNSRLEFALAVDSHAANQPATGPSCRKSPQISEED
jgi:hypothetical protein